MRFADSNTLPIVSNHETIDPWVANLCALKVLPQNLSDILQEEKQRLASNATNALAPANTDDKERENSSLYQSNTENGHITQNNIILLGLGSEDILQKYLGQNKCILVIEPILGNLIQLFSQNNLSEKILDGHLDFYTPNCSNQSLKIISLQECTLYLQHHYLKWENDFSIIKSDSYHLNKDFFDALLDAQEIWSHTQALWGIAEKREKDVNHLDQNKKNILNLPLPKIKSKKPTKHDFSVISPKCSIFNDLAYSFQSIGLKVFLITMPDDAPNALETDNLLLKTIKEETAKQIICRNRSGFETVNPRQRTSLENVIDTPITHWWWDTPNVASTIDLQYQTNYTAHLAFARDMLNLLPAGSTWLPAGAQSRFCKFKPEKTPESIDISFVGQSRVKLLLINVESYILCLSDLVDKKLLSLFKEFNQLKGLAAYYYFLKKLKTDTKPQIKQLETLWPKHAYYLKYILNMSITIAFRLASVQKLIQSGLNVIVFGDDDWLNYQIIPKENFSGKIQPNNLPKLYHSSKINLNLNFMQVSSALNPKVFDILASGGCVLSDYRPEINNLYPDSGNRPFVFNSLDELPELAANILGLKLKEHRKGLQSFTREHHSLQHRAQWLVDYLL